MASTPSLSRASRAPLRDTGGGRLPCSVQDPIPASKHLPSQAHGSFGARPTPLVSRRPHWGPEPTGSRATNVDVTAAAAAQRPAPREETDSPAVSSTRAQRQRPQAAPSAGCLRKGLVGKLRCRPAAMVLASPVRTSQLVPPAPVPVLRPRPCGVGAWVSRYPSVTVAVTPDLGDSKPAAALCELTDVGVAHTSVTPSRGAPPGEGPRAS